MDLGNYWVASDILCRRKRENKKLDNRIDKCHYDIIKMIITKMSREEIVWNSYFE